MIHDGSMVVNTAPGPAHRYLLNGVTSYAHKDANWALPLMALLAKFLVPDQAVRHLGGCEVDHFVDRRILTGERWFERIMDAFAEADFAFLFLSLRFCSSAFVKDHEVPTLMAQFERKAILPLAVGPFDRMAAQRIGIAPAQIFWFDPGDGSQRTFSQVGPSNQEAYARAAIEQLGLRAEGLGWF